MLAASTAGTCQAPQPPRSILRVARSKQRGTQRKRAAVTLLTTARSLLQRSPRSSPDAAATNCAGPEGRIGANAGRRTQVIEDQQVQANLKQRHPGRTPLLFSAFEPFVSTTAWHGAAAAAGAGRLAVTAPPRASRKSTFGGRACATHDSPPTGHRPGSRLEAQRSGQRLRLQTHEIRPRSEAATPGREVRQARKPT